MGVSRHVLTFFLLPLILDCSVQSRLAHLLGLTVQPESRIRREISSSAASVDFQRGLVCAKNLKESLGQTGERHLAQFMHLN